MKDCATCGNGFTLTVTDIRDTNTRIRGLLKAYRASVESDAYDTALEILNEIDGEVAQLRQSAECSKH